MKKILAPAQSIWLLIPFLLAFLNWHCEKGHHYMNDGVLTGYDARMCACCGGLMISLEDSTRPYAGNYYLITNDPPSLQTIDKTHFPVYVRVDWKPDTHPCGTARIEILDIVPR